MLKSPLLALPFLIAVGCGGNETSSGDGDGDSASSGGNVSGDGDTGDGDVGDGDAGDGDVGTGGTSTSGGAPGDGDGDASGGGGQGSGGDGLGGDSSGGDGSGGDGSGGATASCTEDCEGLGFTCCNGECVNTGNDINNCGACGEICAGSFPYCNGGTCGSAPCSGNACMSEGRCCGAECCGETELCCQVNIGPSVLGCFEAENGTCPKGCPMCECAHPDTPIATPSGEVPISDLRIGDLVYSVDEHGIVVVPLLQVNRTTVENHKVLSIQLESGRELRISANHPLGDGRVLSDLKVGETLHGASILTMGEIAYDEPATYDILPASATGIYFAAGLPIGSTLAEAPGDK